jgi:type IV fimbrial biogenesis protein FimT
MNTTFFQQGFTTVELMVTLTVVGVVLTAGIPNLNEMIQNNRLTSYVNAFVGDLNLARSEAIKRAQSVTLCKRNIDATGCDDSAPWVNGWIVFAEQSGCTDGVVDCDETILREHGALTGLQNLRFSRNRITYGPTGFAVGFTGTLSFCDNRGVSKARGRVLSNNGRLRASTSSDRLTCS